jgi:ribosomal protein S18 acetylase RimI-like enzyme
VTVAIRPLDHDDAAACDAIVRSLPYHFGDEAGRADCAAAVRSQRGFVAEDPGAVVGFLTFEDRFDQATEITWMAVRSDRRRKGIGRTLLDAVVAEASSAGRRLLVVLTVSPSDGADEIPDGYQATRAFYRSNGFVLARDFPGLWTRDTPVLMVRVLEPTAAAS